LGRIGAAGEGADFAATRSARSIPAGFSRGGVLGFPFRWLGRRRTRDRTLVQGELSLESVQVVRNDLRDADFAVKRPARAVAARLRQSDAADSPPVLAVASWRRWVGAFFRMGN
jgi:hypothetical protein